jgi:hypothetical protein
MKCSFCEKEMKLIDSWDSPTVTAGSRLYQCEDHPDRLERTAWYCPYVPLEFIDLSIELKKP